MEMNAHWATSVMQPMSAVTLFIVVIPFLWPIPLVLTPVLMAVIRHVQKA